MDASNPSSPGAKLRALLAEPGIMVAPGVYDGFSLRLVEQMGYKTAAISGAGLSESNLGWADVGIMGYTETACLRGIGRDQLHPSFCRRRYRLRQRAECLLHGPGLRACRTGVPADRGSGVAETVRPYGGQTGHLRRGRRREVRAAAEARRDPDFVIKARTDATAIHGIGEAIRRLNLYAEAGADLLFADALLTAEDIATVAAM